MKKLLGLLFMVSIIFSSCVFTSEESSYTPKNEISVLIGGEYNIGGSKYTISECAEISEERMVFEPQDNVLNKDLEFVGIKIPLTLWIYQRAATSDRNILIYKSLDGQQTFTFDETTDTVVAFALSSFPEGLEHYTDKVDIETAYERCIDFINKNLCYASVDESWHYDSDFTYDSGIGYCFRLYKYSNDIKTGYMGIDCDYNGNITVWNFRLRTTDNIPNLDESEYINGAKNRIEDYYSDKSDISSIDNYRVFDKSLVYLNSRSKYAIQFGIMFDVHYTDGTVETTGNSFYYLIEDE